MAFGSYRPPWSYTGFLKFLERSIGNCASLPRSIPPMSIFRINEILRPAIGILILQIEIFLEEPAIESDSLIRLAVCSLHHIPLSFRSLSPSSSNASCVMQFHFSSRLFIADFMHMRLCLIDARSFLRGLVLSNLSAAAVELACGRALNTASSNARTLSAPCTCCVFFLSFNVA